MSDIYVLARVGINQSVSLGGYTIRGYMCVSEFERAFLSPFLPRCMKCRRGLATRILSVRLSVCCPSVRPSVTRVIPDKMEERLVQIFISYERTFILVF